jgi:hypothetical protein
MKCFDSGMASKSRCAPRWDRQRRLISRSLRK